MAVKKFPLIKGLAWASSKMQKWQTTVQRTASGRVRTLTNQLYPLWYITAKYNAISDANARIIQGFVADIKGSYQPFYWLDPEDSKAVNMPLAKLSNVVYQACMQQGDYIEPVSYIEDLKIYFDGELQKSGYSLNGGVITFSVAPPEGAKVTADYTYFWKVQLDGDGLTINRSFRD
ncbi:MAG: DUF2460 domain-containing protein, partial [Phascolarctobacterium sp.]